MDRRAKHGLPMYINWWASLNRSWAWLASDPWSIVLGCWGGGEGWKGNGGLGLWGDVVEAGGNMKQGGGGGGASRLIVMVGGGRDEEWRAAGNLRAAGFADFIGIRKVGEMHGLIQWKRLLLCGARLAGYDGLW